MTLGRSLAAASAASASRSSVAGFLPSLLRAIISNTRSASKVVRLAAIDLSDEYMISRLNTSVLKWYQVASAVSSRTFLGGMRLTVSTYVSTSKLRQHLSLAHCPASFCGLSEMSWKRAALVETLTKFCIHDEQHSGRPQGPMPPMRPASWRAPICFISMRILKVSAKTLINWRKSTRASAM